MQADICRHIKTSGIQCRAVALTGSAFCYYHRRLHTAHAPYRHNEVTRGYLLPGQHIQLAPLEDRDSVLLAASQVVNALATGNLDIKRATALFYGLQVAGAYAPQVSIEPAHHLGTRTVHTSGDLSEAPGVDLASPGRVHEIDPDFYDIEQQALEDDNPPDPAALPDPPESPAALAIHSSKVLTAPPPANGNQQPPISRFEVPDNQSDP